MGGASAQGPLVSRPVTAWKAVKYGSANPTDPINDQQTGTTESDLVGTTTRAYFYTMFDPGSAASLTDGTMYFRARVGGDPSPAGFKANLFVGIDANNNGGIDLFLGVHHQGSNNELAIWNPGTGLNNSPNTTSIVSPALKTYVQNTTVTNYNFMAVTATNDPGQTNFDLDGGGKTDFFLSFSFPMSDVVSQLAARGVTGVNENTQFHYVLATATQDNSLNEDIGGVAKISTINKDQTFQQLGALSDLLKPSSTAIPEPGSLALLGGGLATGALLLRRRRLV